MGNYSVSQFRELFGGAPEPGEAYPDDPDRLLEQAEERACTDVVHTPADPSAQNQSSATTGEGA